MAMSWFNKLPGKKRVGSAEVTRHWRFRTSIYSRVVVIITILSLFLFISYGIIFRSVNERYMESVISENGNNIGYLVEGALYRSMLENDRTRLQGALDRINKMTGIDDVNMYDHENNLVYTSIPNDSTSHGDPNCISCHKDFDSMFSVKEKSYRIIDANSKCTMNPYAGDRRQLLIKSPILNQQSCYTSSCHAHSQEEEVLGSLIIKLPLTKLDNALRKSTSDYFLFASLSTILLMLVLIYFTHKRIRKPLKEIVSASEAVTKGDTSMRLKIVPGQLSDMRMVSNAFNDMLDNLQKANLELQNWSHQLEYKVQKKSEELGQAQNELINIERIASLGKLSLSVAHEINNPLSGILIYTKLIYKQIANQELEPVKKESILKHLRLVENETKRCGDIVKSLLDFSKKDQEGFEPKHLHEILTEMFELISHSMKIANIHFWSDFRAPDDLIYCSPNQCKQACIAILVNAMEAVSTDGEVQISSLNPNGENIQIDITDNGVGISEEDLPHVFEPFYSTKNKTSGTGLGLAIVHGIVQSHKGKISIKSVCGKGTTISITIPLIKTEKQQP
jgi:two-component system, NtrC family, sensor kinase